MLDLFSIGYHEECGECGQFGECDADQCDVPGSKEGTKKCWEVRDSDGVEREDSRKTVPCTEPCSITCVEVCDDECGNLGPCSESCGADGIMKGTKECWNVNEDTRVEIPSSRHTVDCDETCFNKCPVEICDDECGNFGPCSESCGADGIMKGTKECWLVDADTRVELPSSRHTVDCDGPCFNKCPVEVCDDECGNFGPCSESCGADGIMKGTKECWMVDADTRVEIPSTRRTIDCEETCFNKCPVEECDECGNFGPCSESCGADGTMQGTKECWLVDADTRVELPSSRHTVDCEGPCFNKCPVEVCDDECGNFGPCSESCGADGIMKGTKECWLVDADTRVEIPSSRRTIDCDETCFNKCPVEECDECGNFGPCSESCGADGTMQGTKECWLVDADTRVELPSSRHTVDCEGPCFNKCPVEVCDDECGNFGPCSESCGADGIMKGTKECWLVDADTRVEIPSSRRTIDCDETCFNKCPVEECDECGNFGPCSESCGADGIMQGTKECWLVDADTRVELPGSRRTVDCEGPCFNKCPIEVCDDECGNFGPCSESCGADGIMQGTKECWLVDADTRVELPSSRHTVDCNGPCFIPCPTCKVYNLYFIIIIVLCSCFIFLLRTVFCSYVL